MKKIFFVLFTFCTLFLCTQLFSANCSYDGAGDIGSALDGCLGSNTKLVTSSDYTVEAGFKEKIKGWTATIAGLLGLLAVGAIVYGALLMTISNGDEEKINKGKDIAKRSIIGFLGVVSAGGLISLLVNFIFAVG